MKEDIFFPKVTDVKVAIAKEVNEKGESDWYAYVLNNKPAKLENLMVVSSATENEDGSGRETSKLRHFVEELEAGSFAKIERVDPAVFGFYNQFWVSFYIGRQVFDKKFTVEPFQEWEVEEVAELDMQGKVAS